MLALTAHSDEQASRLLCLNRGPPTFLGFTLYSRLHLKRCVFQMVYTQRKAGLPEFLYFSLVALGSSSTYSFTPPSAWALKRCRAFHYLGNNNPPAPGPGNAQSSPAHTALLMLTCSLLWDIKIWAPTPTQVLPGDRGGNSGVDFFA